MKKMIALILALVMCAAFVAGCGNSGSSSNNNSGNNSNVNNDANSNGNTEAKENDETEATIVGTWTGDEAGESITYTFKADGTFNAGYASGTYTISGDKITLSADVGGQEIKLFDNASFSINGNTLQMGEYTYTKG